VAVLLSGCKKQDSEPSGGADANQVKQELTEAAQTAGAYLSKEKDALVEQANETYNQLKSDTEQLIADMKESGKENYRQLSSDLDGKLNAAQKKLGELKEAGSDTLQKSSDAFKTAVSELEDAYQKTKAEFEKSEQQTGDEQS
jgi:uncharacterized protein YicC (UPF0701 family)